MKTHRLARVAEVVREVAATTILFEIRDPRVKNVTVTRAEVSADLQAAKVYVSIMGTERDQVNAMHGLKNSAGFIQSKLAKRLLTRFLPIITFVKDDGVKKSVEIARILAEEKARRGETDGPAVIDDDEEDDDDDGAEVDDDDADSDYEDSVDDDEESAAEGGNARATNPVAGLGHGTDPMADITDVVAPAGGEDAPGTKPTSSV
jgi:ribosome-binding factor A